VAASTPWLLIGRRSHHDSLRGTMASMAVDFSSADPHRVRVRYCETDRMGVAHHASYVAWFEEARSEWLRRLGRTYRQLEDEGFLLQIVDMGLHYRKSVDYDDELLIRMAVVERSKASITLAYEIRLQETDEVTTTGHTRLACVGPGGRPRRLPDMLQSGQRDRS
jgi:acyl-CoA thioester hydrolase